MAMTHPQMKDNRDILCYFITKHSWKGKYKRVFSVGTLGITTYNPQTLEVTNQWPYEEFVKIEPNIKALGNNEFLITMKKGVKKTDQMKFSSDHRADILTEALRYQHLFAVPLKAERRFQAYKYHWSDSRVLVALQVNAASLDQIDVATNKKLCSYDYKDMEGLVTVSDYPGGFCLSHGGFNRLHLFALQEREELIKCITEAAAAFVGVVVKQRKDPITFEQFQDNKMGKYSTDEALTSYAEFTVQKTGERHPDPIRRLLCITECCLVERDPATYNVVTCKPLSEVSTIVRDPQNPQQLSLEYVKGTIRVYASTERDSLIASLLDGVRASGNRDVCVTMSYTDRSKRLGPFVVPVDEEVESQHLRFIQATPANMTFAEAVTRFNSNVSYSGLLHAVTADGLFVENKEKLINGTIAALLEREGDQTAISNEELEMQFHALRRLVASKAGYMAFTQLPGMREKVGLKVVKALKRSNDGVTHAAIDMINALMVPMHDNYELRQEQMNKSSLLSSKAFLEKLLDMFVSHIQRDTGALVVTAMLDFLTFALCAPYSETTESSQFDAFLETVANIGRSMFKLFQHPSMAIVKGAGLVMKAIIEEGSAEVAARMQALSLAEGALPRHLHTAMFTQSADGRALTNRQLSRHLVGLWVTGHPTAMALLKRIMPAGLLSYLDSEDQVPEREEDRMHVRDNLKLVQDQFQKTRSKPLQWRLIEKQIEGVLVHWRERVGMQKKQKDDRPMVLRKRRQRIKSEANWLLFYYYFNKDHAKPNLIWNYKTREELKESLENEMRAFNVDRELTAGMTIAWNHSEFEVDYKCLAEEIRIGDYYLRLLLEEDENDATSENSTIKKSYEFFNDLYHRFLLTPKVNMKCMCLQAMAIVYGRCHEEIGAFNDTKYIVGMLDRSTDRLERDRLLMFLNKLILNKANIKMLVEAGGVRILVELATLAHLHTNRATVPLQSNVIEAAPDMRRDGEKEWYYGNKDKERLGPCSYDEIKDLYKEGVVHDKTRCWAQGMDGWRPLLTVTQLKWTLAATGQASVNESDLAALILNMLISICECYPSRDADGAVVRPLPRAKRLLSDAACLPHIIQLLLTFDPVLVEKVATLLLLVMQDNPGLSRLYLTGVFFFIMMYTGSNVLPVARFLKYTHLKQAFRSDENKSSDIMVRSVMGHILPEAMVCYLENYESEQFAQIFLGEFDTPEAIWSAEMRRLMIERIAAHLADFSPRLPSNIRALYQYCSMPVVTYPQLDHELFCSMYYLRHLCDTVRFPDWPIKDPITLLKEILNSWKAEVEKKPPTMSLDEAYKVLGLPLGVGGHDESKVRKAYFRLAQKYHPDKNPDGREMFESVNKAYEFLCAKSRLTEGPSPENIVLVLKSQSILFSRYKDELEPYKYSGYPMLIKTIQMESHDDALFSKSAAQLTAASELAYLTVRCSSLNAEELRREGGLQTVHGAFGRCLNVLSLMSKPEDMAVQVCTHIAKCYAVASQFQGCREVIQELPAIVKDVCRVLYYKNVTKLCLVVAECISAFSIDYCLQTALYQAGALWHLLLFLFNYDFTLEESGVESNEESNQQRVANELAKMCVIACARLSGYAKGLPDNPAVKASLNALLTPYLARKLAAADSSEVLKILNSNTENPYLMWDNGTRAELVEYLGEQQIRVIKTGECDPHFGANFVSTVHAKELIIGEIFVRIYNEQPVFPLENAKGFAIDLLAYLGSQSQYLNTKAAMQPAIVNSQPVLNPQVLSSMLQPQIMQPTVINSQPILNPQVSSSKPQPPVRDRTKSIQMAMEALRNVIKNNAGVEIQCIGYFKLLFSMMSLDGCLSVQQGTLEVINIVTGNQECVSDIAASEVLANLLLLFATLPRSAPLIVETLYSLSSNTKIVKEAMGKGALVYLLDLFCNNTNPAVREKAAELFAKLLSDKLIGPRVRIVLGKFLPSIFMDAMRDSPSAAVHMFEGAHENPELIWNDEAREKVASTVASMKARFSAAQRENPDVRWNLPEDFSVVYADAAGELVIGGVFLRLFIANPGWVLRKPKDFMVELMEKWTQLTSSQSPSGEHLETVTTALVNFLLAQPAMLDQVPQLGYLPKIFQAMSARNEAFPKYAIQIVHQLASNDVCVRSMAATVDSVGPLKLAMKVRRDQVSMACETLARMFSKGHEELVAQALKHELVAFLLRLLEPGGALEGAENPAATKAQIVKALKAMQASLQHGQTVTDILEQSRVWKDYRDQKHDLFISDRSIAGYLTGAAPAVAGYLTAGTGSSNLPDAPPPVIDHQHDNEDG